AIDSADGARAALALGASLLVLAALRTAAAFDPSMNWWGMNALRFAAPWFGWAPWLLVGAALFPLVARAAEPRLAGFGDALARNAFGARAGFAMLAAGLVLVFPDRVWLIGDFLLRLGCTRGQIPVSMVFPQALPLDLFLHHHVPVALASSGLTDPNLWERGLGAIEAGALAFASASVARRLGLRGVAAAATAGLIVFSGVLGMFTGYGKAFVELTLATVATAAFALRVVQEGRGAWALAATVAVALTLHRSALALLVPLVVTAVLWWRSHGSRSAKGRAATLAAFASPLVVALAFSPLILAAMKVTDLRHLAPQGRGGGAILAAAFAPAHLRDVVNLVAMGAPFALAAPVLALVLARPLGTRAREGLVIASFVAPALAVLLFVHPRQGLFRDVDVFAPSLAALAVAGAALAGEALRGAGTRAWLAVPVLAFALLSMVQSLSLAADVTRGLERVRAYLAGPPRRVDEERALMWTYLAERHVALGNHDQAVAAFEQAVELAPSPRILTELALAELDRRNYAGAQRAYARAVERAPTYTEGWLGLADASIGTRDWIGARRALATAAALEPGRPEIEMIARALAKAEAGAAVPR
ncbi:MAG: tetratricopeptide repeat protein, partial [Candidatus Eisenbacteria bacterium]